MRFRELILCTVLVGCAAPRVRVPAHGDSNSRATHAPISKPDPAGMSAAEDTNVAATYARECTERSGDPRVWRWARPSECDDSGMQAAYSRCTWFVSLASGAVHAEFRPHPVAPAPTLPFEPNFLPRQHDVLFGGEATPNLDKMPPMRPSALFENEQGYLVGFDSGKWGGGLYWYDREGALRQSLLGDNVVRLVPRGRRMLVFTGLAHLTMDVGAAQFLEFDGQSWQLLRTRDLTTRPLVFADEPDGAILVIGGRRIVRVTPDERVEPVFLSKHGFWDPNSVVREPDGKLYLGSRYVVIRLQPTADGYDETWLSPEGATRPRPEAGDAECG